MTESLDRVELDVNADGCAAADPMTTSDRSCRVRAHLVCVVGARPNFVKMAPILRALETHSDITSTLVHTGQHYDVQMSDVFFQQLGMRMPEVSLEVGSGKHGEQTARIMERFESVLESLHETGRAVSRTLVVGDVNSTMACALASVKMGIG